MAETSGKPVAYENMNAQAFRTAALQAGLPDLAAKLLSDTDAGVEKGALFEDGGDLARLIARPTTPWRTTIGDFVRGGQAAAQVSNHG